MTYCDVLLRRVTLSKPLIKNTIYLPADKATRSLIYNGLSAEKAAAGSYLKQRRQVTPLCPLYSPWVHYPIVYSS